MEPSTTAADSQRSAAQPAPQNRVRAKMLIAAALALAGCRLLGAWQSIMGTSAAGIVMVALAIGIVSVSPRLRRVIFWLSLPLAVVANAATLGRKISGKGLSKLASLPRLSALELRNVPLNDDDLSALEHEPLPDDAEGSNGQKD